jgi:hypothetical protein
MTLDWKLVGIAVVFVLGVLALLTFMAVKGLVAGALVASAATGAIGWFTGWLQRQPRKDE